MKQNNSKIHFLPTVWSSCIIIEINGSFGIIDTGRNYQKNMIFEYMNSLNIKHLDFIIITHFHIDHYENVVDIVNEYKTDVVYLKPYSGLDQSRNDGKDADDEYREIETNKYNYILDECRKKTKVIEVDKNTKNLNFNGTEIKLFNKINRLKKIFNDKKSKHYQEYRYSENINCLMIYMKVNDKNILISGDIYNYKSSNEHVNRLEQRFADKINEQIDYYYFPHHGAHGEYDDELLKTINPKNIIMSNSEETLSERYNFVKTILDEFDTNLYYLDKSVVIADLNQKN